MPLNNPVLHNDEWIWAKTWWCHTHGMQSWWSLFCPLWQNMDWFMYCMFSGPLLFCGHHQWVYIKSDTTEKQTSSKVWTLFQSNTSNFASTLTSALEPLNLDATQNSGMCLCVGRHVHMHRIFNSCFYSCAGSFALFPLLVLAAGILLVAILPTQILGSCSLLP